MEIGERLDGLIYRRHRVLLTEIFKPDMLSDVKRRVSIPLIETVADKANNVYRNLSLPIRLAIQKKYEARQNTI